jgi:hypothetical protein
MGGKAWQKYEDQFLFAYYPAVGDYVGTHDLDRPKGAATQRVAFLKKCGAWDALRKEHEAHAEYYKALGSKRGKPLCEMSKEDWDAIEAEMAELDELGA